MYPANAALALLRGGKEQINPAAKSARLAGALQSGA